MNVSNPSLLFLSGAGLPGWIWDDVRGQLGESYATQVAPRPISRTAGIRDYAQAAIDSVPTERFVIVAHSAGGVIGQEVARLVPERVAGFLGVSAIVPQPGGSFLTALPIPKRWLISIVMRLAGTRPPESAIRKTFAHGLSEEVTSRLIADFIPEPQSYYRELIGTNAFEGPCGYITTTNDREIPVALQQRFVGNLGATWQYELPTGHLPMLEDPDVLAEAIRRFLSA